MSLSAEDGNYYEVGPTLLKSFSIIVPILLIEITKKYYTNNQKIKLEPIILFNSVDFPAFGNPTIATKPAEVLSFIELIFFIIYLFHF